MGNRNSNKSVGQQVRLVQEAFEVPEPPAGCTLDSDEHRTIWQHLCRARTLEHWRESDLLVLYRLTRIEMDLRAAEGILARSGLMIRDEAGKPVPNPILPIVDLLRAQHLRHFRALKMGEMPDPRTIAGRAIRANEVRLSRSADQSLLARPN